VRPSTSLPVAAVPPCGRKIHEDYGADPELIDAGPDLADDHDVSVALHADGLHESAELEDTAAAIAGRTLHACHVEGTGGARYQMSPTVNPSGKGSVGSTTRVLKPVIQAWPLIVGTTAR